MESFSSVIIILIAANIFGCVYADFAQRAHPIPQGRQVWWPLGGMIAVFIFVFMVLVFNPIDDRAIDTLLIGAVFVLAFLPQIPAQRAIDRITNDNELIARLKRSE